MEKLIMMLDALMESGNYTTTVSEEDGCVYLGGDDAIEIDYVACDLLIGLNGYPDRDAIEQLLELSNGRYSVTPGGTDTFEWVAGCIHTPAGIVVYG